MKTFFTFFILIFLLALNSNLNAQEVKRPLTDKVINETIPMSPGETWTWVKGHYHWDGGRYIWKKGMYTEIRNGYSWMDGEWERDQKSGWWKYNDGYWKKNSEKSDVKNDNNTTKEDKVGKDKRKDNKSGGMFIKTGSSK